MKKGKGTSKKKTADRKSEIDTLSKKYESQLNQFGLDNFPKSQGSDYFKKCTILNEDFIFISSSHLVGTSGI